MFFKGHGFLGKYTRIDNSGEEVSDGGDFASRRKSSVLEIFWGVSMWGGVEGLCYAYLTV